MLVCLCFGANVDTRPPGARGTRPSRSTDSYRGASCVCLSVDSACIHVCWIWLEAGHEARWCAAVAVRRRRTPLSHRYPIDIRSAPQD
jgi:hypothetical protein